MNEKNAQLIRNLGWGVLVYVAFMEGDGMYFLGNSELEIGWGFCVTFCLTKNYSAAFQARFFGFLLCKYFTIKRGTHNVRKHPPGGGRVVRDCGQVETREGRGNKK